MQVSVVIPVHNGEKTISMCLNSLSNQKTTHGYTVIVVDNGSSDGSRSIADSWSDRLDIVVLDEPRVGRGSARATGFDAATTHVVLSTDADTFVPPNWVETLVNTLITHPDTAAVTTSCFISDGSRWSNFCMSIGMPIALRLFRLFRGHYLLTGSTFAILKWSYDLAGGFDRDVAFLEDIELASRVANIGRIRYLPHPRVLTFDNVFRKGFIRGFLYYFLPYLKTFRNYRE